MAKLCPTSWIFVVSSSSPLELANRMIVNSGPHTSPFPPNFPSRKRQKDLDNMALMRPIIQLVVVQLHIANRWMMMHIAAFVRALLDMHLVKAGSVEIFCALWGAVDASRYPPFLMDEMVCREQQKPISCATYTLICLLDLSCPYSGTLKCRKDGREGKTKQDQ